jgi:hypothetical protein
MIELFLNTGKRISGTIRRTPSRAVLPASYERYVDERILDLERRAEESRKADRAPIRA